MGRLDYLQLSEQQREELLAAQPETHSWLGESYEVLNGQLIVKGLWGQALPVGWPDVQVRSAI